MNLKFLMTRLKQIKLNIIQVEKQLKFLRCHLKIFWKSMNIWWQNKQDKYLVYNLQHSFVKFKNIDEFNELSLDSMYRRLNDFWKRVNRFKIVNQQTDTNKVLGQKVLDDVGNILMNCIIFTRVDTTKKKMV